MSGNDKPAIAAYTMWAQLNNDSTPWTDLATGVQAQWAQIAQAAIDAD